MVSAVDFLQWLVVRTGEGRYGDQAADRCQDRSYCRITGRAVLVADESLPGGDPGGRGMRRQPAIDERNLPLGEEFDLVHRDPDGMGRERRSAGYRRLSRTSLPT
jgi:hypothetical protein